MRYLASLLVLLAGAPLVGQAWDLRVETPFADGQRLPAATVQGLGPLVDGGQSQGKGMILSLNHRLVRVNPVLRLDWMLEYTQWKADGTALVGTETSGTRLKQSGVGAGLNAQFWIPFSGVAGELGLIQRFQDYEYDLGSSSLDSHLSRTWLRAGLRWRLALPLAAPYVAVSYQRPVSVSHPTELGSVQNRPSYLAAQGMGQEFDRLWTLGVGIQF